MGGWESLLITISAVSPTTSIFVIGADAIHQGGSGAFPAFMLASVLGLAMAYVYAELNSAFPLSGSEYTIAGRLLGPVAGFMTLGVNVTSFYFGGAVMALGVADYLSAAVPGIPALPLALVTVTGATLVGVLNIRISAKATAVCLVIEMAALAMLSGPGLLHPHRGLAALALHPQAPDGHGGLAALGLAGFGAVVPIAMYAYDGYGSIVSFGEEIAEAPRRIGRVVLAAFFAAVALEMVPITAVLLGAGDLRTTAAAANPVSAFLTASVGAGWARAVDLAVAVAVVNATLTLVLLGARQTYGAARDGVVPGAGGRWLTRIHPRTGSPWASTIAAGAATGACCFIPLPLLVILNGSGIVLIYIMLCWALLRGRRNGGVAHAPFRAPLHPLAPLVAGISLLAVVGASLLDPASGRPGVLIALGIMAAFAAWYLLVLKPRGEWALAGPMDAPMPHALERAPNAQIVVEG
jgi:amino acid transporter